jgi:hypothetical protein
MSIVAGVGAGAPQVCYGSGDGGVDKPCRRPEEHNKASDSAMVVID